MNAPQRNLRLATIEGAPVIPRKNDALGVLHDTHVKAMLVLQDLWTGTIISSYDRPDIRYRISGKVGHRQSIEYLIQKVNMSGWEKVQDFFYEKRVLIPWREVRIIKSSPFQVSQHRKANVLTPINSTE